MAAFTIENLNFTYPQKEEPALRDLNLQVEAGEFLVLCGKSGSGKSTLLRNLKTALAPHGKKEGTILFDGQPLEQVSQREQAQRIGYVLQNPDSQTVTDKVWHELAFGLESLGCDTKTIRLRVAEMASFFGIQAWFMRDVSQLSGGQKQLLNLASVMAMQPDVLILDEPTSQLDPIAAGDFLETVAKINRELGTTIILSEHQLEDVVPMADRTVVMDQGRILAAGTGAEVGEQLAQTGHEMLEAMPAPLQAYVLLKKEHPEGTLPCPINVRQGRTWLNRLFSGREVKSRRILPEQEADVKTGAEPVLRMKDVWFKYSREDEDVIKGLSLEAYKGQLLCLVGGNGTGKTTALSLASGMNKPYRGTIRLFGKRLQDYREKELFGSIAGMLPQNPQSLFSEKTVGLELLQMLEGRGLNRKEQEERIREVADTVQLDGLLDMHPYDLSGGEQQRTALAKMLLLNPKILFLDEPTKGLDTYFKNKLAQILKTYLARGNTIVMVSHDIEFCARWGDQCAMLFNGSIITADKPRSFFSGNSFYTTAANRMSRHIFENAITPQDIALLCRNNLQEQQASEEPEQMPSDPLPQPPLRPGGSAGSLPQGKDIPPPGGNRSAGPADGDSGRQGGLSAAYKNNLCTVLMLALACITIAAGCLLLSDRRYYVISLLLILYTMIPFAVRFEGRRPPAREVVLTAVLIAIAVAGRAAFFMLPQFKPVLALVIIAAMAMGRDTGFFIGAMTAFVSNFIFGQGPWTPWQMLAMGLVGFAAGSLAQRKLLQTGRISVLILGACSALLYGLIVDLWTIISMTSQPSLVVALTVYGTALPFNLILGAATVVFLYFLEKPMTEKLDRIKRKYGIAA